MPDAAAAGAEAGKKTAADRADTITIKFAWVLTGVAFLLSYRGLYDFARHQAGMPHWAALLWPLLFDSLTAIGELRLYSGTRRGDEWWIKAWGWGLVIAGMAASTTANAAGAGSTLWMRLAAAAAPVVAAAALGTGLGLVKLRYRKPSGTGQQGGGALPAVNARPAARPAVTGRARPRQAGQAAARVPALLPLALADRDRGLPMGHGALARRHQITDHTAKLVLAAMPPNGDHPHGPQA